MKRDNKEVSSSYLHRLNHIKETIYTYQTIAENINYNIKNNFFINNMANVYHRYILFEWYAQTKILISLSQKEKDKKNIQTILDKYKNIRNDIGHISWNEPKTMQVSFNKFLKDIEKTKTIGRKIVANYIDKINAYKGNNVDISIALQDDLENLKENSLFK